MLDSYRIILCFLAIFSPLMAGPPSIYNVEASHTVLDSATKAQINALKHEVFDIAINQKILDPKCYATAKETKKLRKYLNQLSLKLEDAETNLISSLNPTQSKEALQIKRYFALLNESLLEGKKVTDYLVNHPKKYSVHNERLFFFLNKDMLDYRELTRIVTSTIEENKQGLFI